MPDRTAERDCDELDFMQSPRWASRRHDDVLHVWSGGTFVGENEKISAVDAGVRVAFQLPTKRINESQLETTKSYARLSRQLESTV